MARPDGSHEVASRPRSFISWNVNGLRSIASKPDGEAAIRRLLATAPHALCLIEHKLQQADTKDSQSVAARHSLESLAGEEGYRAFWTFSSRKGRDGLVALVHRDAPLRNVTYGLPSHYEAAEICNSEGRLMTLEFDKVWLVFVYVPNTAAGKASDRWSYRLGSWEVDVRSYLNELQATKPVVYQGDLNVAHQRELDGWGTTPQQFGGFRAAGRTREEAAAMDCLLHECALVDGFRHLYPEKKDGTCWSSKPKNAPAQREYWKRYDYALVSRALVQLAGIASSAESAASPQGAETTSAAASAARFATLAAARAPEWPLQQEPLCLVDVRHLGDAFEGGQPDHLPVEAQLDKCAAPPHTCAILHDASSDEVLMELRPESAKVAPGRLTCFGGKCEAGEAGIECMLRELDEELGGWQPVAAPKRIVELFVDGVLVAWFFYVEAPARDARIAFETNRGITGEWWPVDRLLAANHLSSWHGAAIRAWKQGRDRAHIVDGADASLDALKPTLEQTNKALSPVKRRLLADKSRAAEEPGAVAAGARGGARSCALANDAAASADAWAEWVSQWHERLSEWLDTPLAPSHEQLGSCLGAFGLHLGSRFQSAHRAWLALMGKPPLPPAPPNGVAEPGCEWLAEQTDKLQLPDFPDFPLRFELPPTDSLHRLLPPLPRLESLGIVSKMHLERDHSDELADSAPRTSAFVHASLGLGTALLAYFACRLAVGARRRWMRRAPGGNLAVAASSVASTTTFSK